MRPDIVGARQREPLAAVLDQPGNEFVALLRRRRAGTEQIGRAFLALVQLRINVERLAARDDHVLDGVAHRTGNAAQHQIDLVALDQLANVADRDRFIRRGVLDEQFQRPAKQPAGVVDFLDHHLCDIGVGVAGVADRTGQIGRDADLDRVRSRIRPVGADDPTADARGDGGAGKGEVGEKSPAAEIAAVVETWTRPPLLKAGLAAET